MTKITHNTEVRETHEIKHPNVTKMIEDGYLSESNGIEVDLLLSNSNLDDKQKNDYLATIRRAVRESNG